MSNLPPSALPYVTAPELDALARRVTYLEAAVAEMQRVLQPHSPAVPVPPQAPLPQATPSLPMDAGVVQPSPPTTTAPPAAAPSPVAQPSARPFDFVRNSEYWLNKVGIGLLLLGIAFLFKYSVDQGWITPLTRVLFGGAIGSSLVGLGLAVHRKRRHFGQVLQGGGIAALYMSIFAAFQLYDLLPYAGAFAAMCLVTLLAFALAVSEESQLLSVVGLVGGLATPFLLYTEAGTVAGLVGYTALLIVGVSAIYLARRWAGLLATSFVGYWLILLLTATDLPARIRPTGDHWAVQAGVLVGALAFWLLPVLGATLRPSPPAPGGTSVEQPQRHSLLQLLILLTPLTSLGVSALTWSLDKTDWGLITLGVAALYAIVTWTLRERDHTTALAYAHGLTALALATISGVLLLQADVLFFALAAEALLLHAVAARWNDRILRDLGHVLFFVVGYWAVARLTGVRHDPPLLNGVALVELLGFGLALAASFVIRPRSVAWVYWLALHMLLLGWLNVEIERLPAGGGLVTVVWGVYGVGLLVAGLRRDIQRLALLGIGTLLLVLAKLFLVDLSELEAIWRIVLFIGFGGAFLLLSYFFQALWRPAAPQPSIREDVPDQAGARR